MDKPKPRQAQSIRAEAAFRARLEELGATLLEPEWLGAHAKHYVRCAAGHECWPKPMSIQSGCGPCKTCAGHDPADAERRFRARLAELGAELIGPYENTKTPVQVRCAAGHATRPTPSSVLSGRGACLACAGKSSAAAEAAFRARVIELGGEPLFTEWRGSTTPHRVRCAKGHDGYPRPNDVQQGDGICRTCAGRDPAAAEAAFLARLAELGAIPLYEKWRGIAAPHHVRCNAGHDCYPWPSGAKRDDAICTICTGRNPAVCEAKFRARVIQLGGEPLYESWRGMLTPHEVRCKAGHEVAVMPASVQQGGGICRFCAGAEWDVFYVVSSGPAVKFGITSGDPRRRLQIHIADGYTEVIRLVTDLPGTVALDTENAVKAALALAGERPVRGKEYFDVSCLALILDVADSWLAVPDTPAAATAAELATSWLQEELFAA